MKKYGIFWGLFLPVWIYAQPVAIMLDKMNTLYVGVPNEITVVVSDLPQEHLVLIPSQGEIKLIDTLQGQYHWTICERISSKAQLILADSSLDHPIDTQYFRVKRIPEPQFKKSNNGIGWVLGGVSCTKYWISETIGFDVTYLPKRQDEVVYHNKGGRFNAEITECLKKLKPGDAIFFSNFRWKVGCDPNIYSSDQELAYKIR